MNARNNPFDAAADDAECRFDDGSSGTQGKTMAGRQPRHNALADISSAFFDSAREGPDGVTQRQNQAPTFVQRPGESFARVARAAAGVGASEACYVGANANEVSIRLDWFV
jgi:hypothetical protein